MPDIKFDGKKAALLVTHALSYLFILTLLYILFMLNKKCSLRESVVKDNTFCAVNVVPVNPHLEYSIVAFFWKHRLEWY